MTANDSFLCRYQFTQSVENSRRKTSQLSSLFLKTFSKNTDNVYHLTG